MGLDITLAAVIFLAAIRGWFKGFVYQAVRIGGLIGCVYLADPVRGQVRPYIAPHFTSIQPAMLDRILWWLACGVTYIVLVGTASLLISLARRPDEMGVKPPIPNDRFAGFLLGAAKGGLVAIFATAGIQEYTLSQLKAIPWTERQVNGSKALAWNQTYHPVPLIWQSPPIQQFVRHIQRMGMPAAPEHAPAAPTASQVAERTSRKSEGRIPRLAVPSSDGPSPLGPEIEAAIDDIKARLDRKSAGSGTD
jgi:uncharacterized membrane protein required for colicin V production